MIDWLIGFNGMSTRLGLFNHMAGKSLSFVVHISLFFFFCMYLHKNSATEYSWSEFQVFLLNWLPYQN